MSNRNGTCIPSSYEDFTGKFKELALANQAFIVHGWIWSEKLQKLIKHAWIEFEGDPELDNKIYEPVTEQFWNKGIMKIQYKLSAVKRYSYMEIMKLSIKTNSKGGEFEF